MKDTFDKASFIFDNQKPSLLKLKNENSSQRKKKLTLLLSEIKNSEEKIKAALKADLGKSDVESVLTEIIGIKTELNFAIKNVGKWMKKKYVPRNLLTSFAEPSVLAEPKGRVLILAPWNYPIMLSINPLISAIASGNAAIIKPSEFTPQSSLVVREICNNVFSPQEVAVIEGDGKMAEHLLSLSFDHIFFTGSPQKGSLVMQAASKHLAGVTLELGGKSPVVVDKNCNVQDAAWKIAFFKFANAGQTCTAPDYILCQSSLVDSLIFEIRKYFEKFLSEGPKNNMCSIVSKSHFDRIDGLIEDARLSGAKIFGGRKHQEKLTIEPTIVFNPPKDSKIMQEEIFGPLLPILKYENLDEAIHYINSKPKPLALYCFSKDKKFSSKLERETTSGAFIINDCVIHHANPNLPFGGINNSGLGSYHGKYGFDELSHQKSIMKSSYFSPFKLILPPYSQFKKNLVNLINKIL